MERGLFGVILKILEIDRKRYCLNLKGNRNLEKSRIWKNLEKKKRIFFFGNFLGKKKFIFFLFKTRILILKSTSGERYSFGILFEFNKIQIFLDQIYFFFDFSDFPKFQIPPEI